jgi:predicted small secreted protein
MQQLTELVGGHDEGGFHALGIKTRRPSFDLVEFLLFLRSSKLFSIHWFLAACWNTTRGAMK